MINRRSFRDMLDGIGRLLKEKGRFAIGVRSHFPRMRGIVAANAVDPPHRKGGSAPRDRYRRPWNVEKQVGRYGGHRSFLIGEIFVAPRYNNAAA